MYHLTCVRHQPPNTITLKLLMMSSIRKQNCPKPKLRVSVWVRDYIQSLVFCFVLFCDKAMLYELRLFSISFCFRLLSDGPICVTTFENWHDFPLIKTVNLQYLLLFDIENKEYAWILETKQFSTYPKGKFQLLNQVSKFITHTFLLHWCFWQSRILTHLVSQR